MENLRELLEQRDRAATEKERLDRLALQDPIVVEMQKRLGLKCSGFRVWLEDKELVCGAVEYWGGEEESVSESIPLSLAQSGIESVKEHYLAKDRVAQQAAEKKKLEKLAQERQYKERQLAELARELGRKP